MQKHLLAGLCLLTAFSALTAPNVIIPGQTTTGTILIDQTNVYTFAGVSAEAVTVVLVRSGDGGSYPVLELIGPDGTPLGSWANVSGLEWLAGVWTLPLPQSGNYTVQCRDDGGNESYPYALTFLKHPGPNAGDEDATEILPGQNITNRLDEAADFDVYTFTGTTNETVTITMVRTGPEGTYPYVDLIGPDGTYLAGLANTSGLEWLAGTWTFPLPQNGTYQILCRDDSLNQAYEYVLTLVKHPGPNPSADKGVISPGQSITNQLDGVNDFDVYTFAGTTNETVTITMVRTGSEGTYPYVDLIGPDGTYVIGLANTSGLEWLAGTWTFPLPQSGTYQILCRDDSLNQAYEYVLTLVKHPGPNPAADKGVISPGQSVTNQLDGVNDFDVYTFTGTTNETVTITMVRTGPEGTYPYVDLIGPDGTYVTGLANTSGLEWLAGIWAYRLPQNGTYQILCRDDSLNQAYEYVLTLVKHPGPNPSADKGVIHPGQSITNQLDGVNDFDVYTFTGTTNETVTITMVRTGPEGTYPYVDLIGPDGTYLTGLANTSGLEWLAGTWTFPLPQNGTYQILCRDDSLNQAYEYVLTLVKHPGPNPSADKGAILPGQTVTGQLDGVNDFDVYTFTGTTNETVTIIMVRTGPEGTYPYVDLIGPDGTYLTGLANTGGLEWLAGIWTYRLPQNGTYQILGRDDSLNQAYEYNLTLIKHPGPNLADSAETNSIRAGGIVTGSIGWGDLDAYDFEVVAGDSLFITVRRTAGDGGFAPYLDLVSPSGVNILGGPVIRLDCVEETGRFQILVRDSALINSGAYELRLRQIPGPPPPGSPPEYLTALVCSGQVVVRWSTNAVGFNLETTASLPGGWIPVSPPYTSFGGYYYVTNQSTDATGFFRLRRNN